MAGGSAKVSLDQLVMSASRIFKVLEPFMEAKDKIQFTADALAKAARARTGQLSANDETIEEARVKAHAVSSVLGTLARKDENYWIGRRASRRCSWAAGPRRIGGDLLRNRQRFVDRDRPLRNTLRQSVTLDQLHHERGEVWRLLETVDRSDVRMVEGREHVGFALNARETIRIAQPVGSRTTSWNLAVAARAAATSWFVAAVKPRGALARASLDEILPEVEKTVRLRRDGAYRTISGMSSGGVAAFTAAWERPNEFSKVLSWVGSFTNIASGPSGRDGGHNYEALVPRAAPRRRACAELG